MVHGIEDLACPLGECPWKYLGCGVCETSDQSGFQGDASMSQGAACGPPASSSSGSVLTGVGSEHAVDQGHIPCDAIMTTNTDDDDNEMPHGTALGLGTGSSSGVVVVSGVGIEHDVECEEGVEQVSETARANVGATTTQVRTHLLARVQRARHGNNPAHGGGAKREYSSSADGTRPTWSQKNSSQKDRPLWVPRYSDKTNASPSKKARDKFRQPGRVAMSARSSLVGMLVPDYGPVALATLQTLEIVYIWPQACCPYCSCDVEELDIDLGRVPRYQCNGIERHIFTFAHGSVFDHDTDGGVRTTSFSPAEALAVAFEFSREHSIEDAIVACGRNQKPVTSSWKRMHSAGAKRGKALQDGFTFGGVRPSGEPKICELDETVVRTTRCHFDGTREATEFLLELEDPSDDRNFAHAADAAESKGKSYVLAHLRVLGICERDSLKCAFFLLPDVFVPPGSAPPTIKAEHGIDAFSTVSTECGGLLCGDGAPAYVQIAENLKFAHLSQCSHKKFQWTRFDVVKLQTPLKLEVNYSKRNSTGTEYKFTSGSQLQESLWRPIKDSMRTRSRGAPPDEVLSYFHLYVWRRTEQHTDPDRMKPLARLLRSLRLNEL